MNLEAFVINRKTNEKVASNQNPDAPCIEYLPTPQKWLSFVGKYSIHGHGAPRKQIWYNKL